MEGLVIFDLFWPGIGEPEPLLPGRLSVECLGNGARILRGKGQ